MSWVRRAALIFLATVAAASGLAQSHAQEFWHSSLSSLAFQEQTALLIDLDYWNPPPVFQYRTRQGVAGLSLFGHFIGRSYVQVGGVSVLRRQMSVDDLRSRTPSDQILDWLRVQSMSTLKRLVDGTFDASTLTAEELRMFRYASVSVGGELGYVMSTKFADELAVRLVFVPQVEQIDAEPMRLLRREPTLEFQKLSVAGPVAFPAMPDEGIDFGRGAVMTLMALAERLGGDVRFDPRLAGSVYFVAGRASREDWLAAVNSATQTLETRPAIAQEPRTSDVLTVIERAYVGRADTVSVLGSASVADCLARKQVQLGELFDERFKASTEVFLDEYGLTLESKVTLSPGLMLVIGTPGFSPVDTGQRDAAGYPIIFNTLHRVRIWF
ncbi:MAG: hypothetical protein IH944_11655 [Armatimonadetes bacterium]|nr:hypothetical protein [Armatimonadota bacterium]